MLLVHHSSAQCCWQGHIIHSCTCTKHSVPAADASIAPGAQLAQKRNEWRAGTYVRVYGHMRTFNNAKSMVAFNIRPITDFNEVGGWGGRQACVLSC